MTSVLENGLIFREIISRCSKRDALNIGMASKNLYALYCDNMSVLICSNVSALSCAIINFKHLVDIDCSQAEVTNEIVEQFPLHLKRLSINECQYINEDLNLSEFKRLETLNCAKTKVSNCTLSTLTCFSSLETLDICFCRNIKSNLDLSPFAQLKTLKYCGSFGVAEEEAARTRIPSSLETLDLSCCFLGYYNESDMSQLVNLKRLYCSENWCLTSNNINRLPSAHIEVLHLCLCFRVVGDQLQLLRFTKLKEFWGHSFQSTHGPNFPLTIEKLTIMDSVVKDINTFDFTQHRNLKVLVFNQFKFRNDTSMTRLPPLIEQLSIDNCSQLQSLNLLKYSKLTRFMCRRTNIQSFSLPVSIEEIVLSEIKVIDTNLFDLSACENLKTFECTRTSVILENMKKRLPKSLLKLDLSYCHLIGDADLTHFSNLQELKFGHTGLSNAVLDKLPLSIEKLEIAFRCRSNSDFYLTKYTNLREFICKDSIISSEFFKNLPLSLEKLDISSCFQFNYFDLSRYTNLKTVKCLRTELSTKTVQKMCTFLKRTSTGDLFFR